MKDAASTGRTTRWILAIGLALAVAWTLRASMMVTLPIAAAVLLALAVAPVASWVREHLPSRLEWLGNVAALLVLVAVLALFVSGIWLAADEVAEGARRDLPQLRQQFQQSQIASLLGGQQLGSVFERLASYAVTFLNMVWQTIAALVLILFLVLFMLIEAPSWRAKLASLDAQEVKWVSAAQAIGSEFRIYFLARLALGVVTALLYMGWLSLFGIDFILVWGLLALLLNFVPTVGSLIAGIFPVLFAFVQKDPGTALMVAGGLLVIEQIMGNYIDPKLVGRRLSVSPLVVLISLLVWGWIWGIPGALIAAPMTVLLIITFARIPALRPVALLLSNQTDLKHLDESTSNADRAQAETREGGADR